VTSPAVDGTSKEMAAAQQLPVDASTAVLAPPSRLVASLRRNDRGPFIMQHTTR
jgi:hypothetical protein